MLNERRRSTMSEPHIQHSTFNIQHSSSRVLLPLTTGAMVLAIWHIAVIATKTPTSPPPAAVALAIFSLAEHRLLWSYIADSLFRIGCGYLAAALAGVPLGI